MAINKINENQYIVRVNVTLSSGHYKRINKVTNTYKEAKKVERRLQAYKKMNGEMLFEDTVELYLDDHKTRWKKSSYEIAKYIIAKRVLPTFKEMPLNRITSSDIHSWQLRLVDENLSSYYIYSAEKQLKNIFKYAVNFLNLSESPFQTVKYMGKASSKEMNFWTIDEFKQVLSVIPEDTIIDFEFKIILYIAFLCGLRLGEILGLYRKDINLSQNSISVNKTYSVLPSGPYISTPKTKNAVRTVTMPSFLTQKLKEYFSRKGKEKQGVRVFEDYRPNHVRKQLTRFTELAGVKRIRFHDLRHSAVSYWIHLGIPIFDISRRCGHASPKITYKVYAHMYPKDNDNIAKLLQNKKEAWDNRVQSQE